MDKITRQVRIEHWTQIMNECLNSGMNKTEWCRANGISDKQFFYTLSEEKLRDVFGTDGWKQLPDEIYKRVRVQPAVYTVEEHHVAVYAGRDNQTIIKADRPKDLLRNSLLTPSLAASIMNTKCR